jgi:hypothetical protein
LSKQGKLPDTVAIKNGEAPCQKLDQEAKNQQSQDCFGSLKARAGRSRPQGPRRRRLLHRFLEIKSVVVFAIFLLADCLLCSIGWQPQMAWTLVQEWGTTQVADGLWPGSHVAWTLHGLGGRIQRRQKATVCAKINARPWRLLLQPITTGKDSKRQSKPKSAQRNKPGWWKQAGVAHPAFGRSEETKGPRLALLPSGRNATVPRWDVHSAKFLFARNAGAKAVVIDDNWLLAKTLMTLRIVIVAVDGRRTCFISVLDFVSVRVKTAADMSEFNESKTVKKPQAHVTSRIIFGKHKVGSSESNKKDIRQERVNILQPTTQSNSKFWI